MIESRPRFRRDIRVHEFHETDGGGSLVLEDPVADRFFRISNYEYEFLRILDGTLTLGEALEKLKLRGRFFSVEHAKRLLEQFSRSGLLLGTGWGSSVVQQEAKERMERAARGRSLIRLYYLYIPLLDPDRFLERTLWLWRLLVNRFTAFLFLLAVPPALYLLLSGLPRLAEEILYFFNMENLLVLWVAIACVKLVHEFSHAYRAKDLGLRVPEMGIVFLLFFPCLYCNTTAAWRLADRKQRMSIAAAGVLSEVVVATVAVYVWYFSNPGLVNSVAFFLMAVSLVTSIFFNANPLMKFDGYFILIDFLNTPNLQTRSFRYIRYLFLNGVLGVESVQDPTDPGADRALLVFYGVSAVIYRVFLYTSIVVGIYYRFDKTVGLILGGLAFVLFVVRPLSRGAVSLAGVRSSMRLKPVGLAVFLLLVGTGAFLLTRPWSTNSVYPCYVESTRVQQITIPANAPVLSVAVREGDRVQAGETLFRLDPEPLEFELKDTELEEAQIRYQISVIKSTGEKLSSLPMKYIELSQRQDGINRIRQEIADLEWRAPFSGVVTRLRKDLQPGAWFEKGTVVGELAGPADCEVVGLVPEADVELLSPGQEVEVWLPVQGGKTLRLTVDRIDPFSRKDLSRSPFSSRYGGEIATRTGERRQKETPVEAYYLCRMSLPRGKEIPLGMTGRLVVHHPPKSALERLVDKAHKVFRREIVF